MTAEEARALRDSYEKLELRIEALERAHDQLYEITRNHTVRLDGIRPEVRNCQHCGRKVGARDTHCRICGNAL